MVHPQNDLGYYDALMARDDIPATTSPSLEIQWLSFKIPLPNGTSESLRAIWDDAPSKVAATWLRQLRMKSKLQARFWTDTWPYYMENRLALELRAAAPPSRKRGQVKAGDGGGVVQESIDQFKKKASSEVSVGGEDGNVPRGTSDGES